MLVQGKHYRTIWLKEGDDKIVQVIDQRFLPHKFEIADLKSAAEVLRKLTGSKAKIEVVAEGADYLISLTDHNTINKPVYLKAVQKFKYILFN